MKPTWVRIKLSSYHSKQPLENVNTASTSSSQDNNKVVVAQVTSPPAKQHSIILREKNSNNENACRVCHLIHNDTFWIGCGHKNKINDNQDCNYWVHQWCINLYFKTEEKLNAAPFSVHDMIKVKRNLQGKNIKISTWNYNT